MSNHTDWAAELRAQNKKYFTKEEAVELSLETAKKEGIYTAKRVRVWKSRYRHGTLGKKTIARLLEIGHFEQAVTLYRQIKTT